MRWQTAIGCLQYCSIMLAAPCCPASGVLPGSLASTKVLQYPAPSILSSVDQVEHRRSLSHPPAQGQPFCVISTLVRSVSGQPEGNE